MYPGQRVGGNANKMIDLRVFSLGIFICLLFYNFFIFVGRKNNHIYLIYVLYCLSLSAITAATIFYTPSMNEHLYLIFMAFFFSVITVSMLLFLYCNFKPYFKRLSDLIAAYVVLYLIFYFTAVILSLAMKDIRICYWFFPVTSLSRLVFICLSAYYFLSPQKKQRHVIIAMAGFSAVCFFAIFYFINLFFRTESVYNFRYPIHLVNAIIITFTTTCSFNEDYRDLERLKYNLEGEINKRTAELAEAKDEIERKERQKTNFFVNIVHETKTPLTLIGNYLDGYMKKNGRSEELRIVKQNIDKLTSDMENFLDVQKLESGQVFYDHDRISDLNGIIRSQIILFKETASGRNLKLNSFLEEGVFIKADPYAVGRVIGNLLMNAIKYNKPGGSVDVELTSSDKEATVKIKDTGTGISEEHLGTIFKPYYQISHEKRNIQGMGVGLSIVKKIVESVGGSIFADSVPDQGSVFTVTFNKYMPESDERIESVSDFPQPVNEIEVKLSEKEYVHGNKNVLIVEDNVQLLAYLSENLSWEYNVFMAKNGKEAFDRLKKIPKPDLVISDIMMDTMNGYGLLDEIRNSGRFRDVPFLFLTALNSAPERLKGIDSGAVDFISKPFSMEELSARIRSIIRNKDEQSIFARNEIENEIYKIFNKGVSDKKEIDLDSKCRQYNISERECEILRYIISGKENKEISMILNLSINTVKTHLHNIYIKFGVQNRIELINLIYDK
jgi:signal transduction histidine kinase/DNA-binding NarL/FixJ family response regulator